MATIYDVANLAKVSAKTVSRVLNGDAPVSRETREAVEAAIAELGFVPSSAARMMRSQKSGLVGLITGAISLTNEPSQPQGLPELFIVQGIQRALSATSMTLMIADTGGRLDRVPDLIQTFLRHRVEGLIYVAEFHQQVELPRVPPTTPFVLANCFDGRGTPAVLPDDRRGQRELVERLIAAGHRRIAYLTLPPHMVATSLRSAGYYEALTAAGIWADPALVHCADYDGREDESQILWDIIDRLLKLPDPPTVLCCGNDKMAMRVYGILRSCGVKVPDEMSVAGYDNYRVIADTLYPPLTTVELSYTAIGVRAAQQMMAMISDPDTVQGHKDQSPTLVSGPVCWRGSVTKRRADTVSKIRIVRED